ncbi:MULTISPECIES: metal ABC transporter permease [Streptococcus]|uniref:metal ABC transporter permease n=1 Tax=Streptococcus TaxID=1301 RepID=UPI00042604EC|nr:iron chelate uptake ABC transporter family permease subunit [Streptococcus suis]MBM0242008.1 metal ABC transporter permease [Streptococcus suis]MBM7205056.1 metal ABC transporter permease [Streptococcus suis]MBM7282503.1 metal ABC transporter permease [Streptococcus suis]MBO4111376.1 metal ABC transporter permease [Streptococcus suis]MBO4136020.1 metal ABC transporter permease [Streptococcus suis]
MFEVFKEYSFWTVALGTVSLAVAASTIGSISVLTKQSLLGDALGHASYPGVIVSFMIFQSRHPLYLLLGAVLSGYLSYALVHWLRRKGGHSLVNALSLVSASFFGLGMVLKNAIQGNEAFAGSSQAGLQTYLFGQAAFIQLDDVILIGLISLLALVLFAFFYQDYKLYLFDQTFARVIGVRVKYLQQLTMFLMICLIAVGLKLVGAILMSSFLIAPAVFGLMLGKSYHKSLLLAGIVAIGSAFVGTWISSSVSGLSTGPTIIVCLTGLTLSAFVYVTYVRKENGRV